MEFLAVVLIGKKDFLNGFLDLELDRLEKGLEGELQAFEKVLGNGFGGSLGNAWGKARLD